MGSDIGGYGAKAQKKGETSEAAARKKYAKWAARGKTYGEWYAGARPQWESIVAPYLANARRSAGMGAGTQKGATAADFSRYGQTGAPAQAALSEAAGYQGGALGNQAMTRMYQQMMEDAAQQGGRSLRGIISGFGGLPMPSYAQTSQQGYAQAYADLYTRALSAYLGGGM